MKKRVGRPKVGAANAKAVLFAVRFTPGEARQINEAIHRDARRKSDWIREALLSVAKNKISMP